MSEFLREIDLNPTINGGPAAVSFPLDVRAMFYFGFTSDGQEIQNQSATNRMLVSWQYGNQPTPFAGATPPPVDEIVDPGKTITVDENHERAHAIVWLDPSQPLPPLGTLAMVRVRAWNR